MRVHELAKELGISSKELIDRLNEKKIRGKNHMSSLDQEVVDLFLQKTKPKKQAKTEETPAVKPVAKSIQKPKAAATQTQVKESKEKVKKVSAASKPKEEKKVEVVTETVVTSRPTPSTSAVTVVPRGLHRTAPLGAEKPRPKEAPKPRPEPQPLKPQVIEAPPKREADVAVPAVKKELRTVEIQAPITVGDLAQAFNVTPAQLIKLLMTLGIFANINQSVNEQVVKRAGDAVGINVLLKSKEEEVEKVRDAEGKKEDFVSRCPVVTMMGHVDHGKTSLLDAIRKSKVADSEVGRITQHIGAYEVRRGEDKFITFLDTPGHEAFSAMRSRGAMVTDVVVLVVAADDGVMPQTIEAIHHAREAGVPIVVAINKMDLPNVNPDRVRQQLQKHDLTPEEWSGKTIMVPVSARSGKGIDNLLESLLLEAEILELKANPKAKARGIVIEGRMNKGEGPTATVIIQNGTLRVGDPIVCGRYYGKIRAIRNNINPRMKEAVPVQAVEIIGLSGVPETADEFHVAANLAQARTIAEKRQLTDREQQRGMGRQKHLTLDDLHSKIAEGKIKELKLIIKTDTQGSLEALTQSLDKLSVKEVRLNVIHGATGPVNESDVVLAAASDAVILGFHVRAGGPEVDEIIVEEGVDVRYYNIIYDAVNDVTKAIEGMLEPTYREVITGRAEIRKIFSSSKLGAIAGAYVVKGLVGRTNRVRIYRNNSVIYEGKLAALRRFKDDVKEVKEGFECGMLFENFDDIHENDIVQSYALEKVAAKLA